MRISSNGGVASVSSPTPEVEAYLALLPGPDGRTNLYVGGRPWAKKRSDGSWRISQAAAKALRGLA